MKTLLASLTCLALLSACGPYTESSASKEQRAQESNQQGLINAIPAPKLQTSLERKNLVERLQRINQENMTGCIYLVNYGTVMAFYPVRGKVTSLNSYLSGDQKPAYFRRGSDDSGWDSSTSGPGWQMVESPDYDGAYGKNTDGIFFFTADTNAYVEWKGEYLWSDQCLALNTQPLMVRQITDK